MNALLLATLLLAAPSDGVRPVGADGKPLNLDFETGTLQDWTAEGDAFAKQPVRGDTVVGRRVDMTSGHQGDFWIGTFERTGDKPRGTLTSVAFKVTHPWATFLIGGGSGAETRVELLMDNKVIYKAHGADTERMVRVAVDLAKYQGKMIQIRLVDNASGGWGHVNFDDFLFHADEPKGIKKQASPLTLDEIKNAGLPPQKAAEAMTVPEGFHVTLFAGEPDVMQPVAFCFDDRGRLWVVEAYTYPVRDKSPGPFVSGFPLPRLGGEGRGEGAKPRPASDTSTEKEEPGKAKVQPPSPQPSPPAKPGGEGVRGDKIVIFEDSNGDGKFDKRTVVIEGLNLVSGIEYGFGGVFVGAAPYLLHIPIKDDKPAGEPVILLDGWGYEDTHETLNSFVWGPDGWLYGCHGVFTKSNVGKPGTPAKERVKLNAGIWRYHPTRKTFEVFAEGTSNPWGLDYNQYGDFFCEACVIPHLFHIVQGGRYTRQAGEHFNPHTYIEIPTCADHLHYLGATPHGGNNKSDGAGGGHAHCGLMCYQGGAWPKEYNGQLFMGNIHGRRINMDIPVPKGSTYVGKHGKDFLLANDAWARFIALKYGPDGNAFLIDWYDKQACHWKQPEIWDRTNGRIYKISYRGTKPVVNLDLAKCTDEELVKYQTHENEWYAAHARRILMERYASKPVSNSAIANLLQSFQQSSSAEHRLRGLWTAYCINAVDPMSIQNYAIHDRDPHVRGWALGLLAQILVGSGTDADAHIRQSEFFHKTVKAAADRQQFSSFELRQILSSARLISSNNRLDLMSKMSLFNGTAWNDDVVLQVLSWYALESLADHDAAKMLAIAETSSTPGVLALAVRRIGASGTAESISLLMSRLAEIQDKKTQIVYLQGLQESARNHPALSVPASWPPLFQKLSQSDSPELRSAALACAVSFRDPVAMDALRAVINDAKADVNERISSLKLLIELKDTKLEPSFGTLIQDRVLRGYIIRAMASLGGLDSPKTLISAFSSFTAIEKRDAIATLASKPAFAMALLDAIEAKTIPSADVPAETIRQLRSFKDAKLNARVEAVWGKLRDTPADRKKLINDWKSKLALSDTPDLANGRAVFAKTCQQCHTLYGVGANVGPDITGSNRADLNYLLENIFDPSAVVQKEYSATTFDLADGRKITGIVKSETPAVLTVATATETVRINVADIESRKPSDLSMMPDDLTKPLTERQVKDLIAYLRNPVQTPMKATEDNVKDFFNGKDLTGWDGDKDVWSVDNGEIVGKSAKGLPRNQFITSALEVSDFKLSLKVKLVPDKENSGVQFRSVRIEGTEMRGPQADIGKGWWGKLYEESGRGLLVKEGAEKHVKVDDWNDYVIEAKGANVKVWINGNLSFDYTDEKMSKKGLIGLQAHGGGPIEVRFKELKLEVLK